MASGDLKQQREIDLSCGRIAYTDTGGGGPALVFLHGLVMDGSVFDPVVADLRADYRCIAPTLPLGSHLYPMKPDADLSLAGLGRLVAEFLDRLDLEDVTLIQNDHAAAMIVAAAWPERIGRMVLSACEAFENYPPGLPGKNAALLARIPGGLAIAMQLMRVRALRRLPIGIGWMSKRPVPDEITDRWFKPVIHDRRVRRDLAKYARTARKRVMIEATEQLRSFTKPVLVIWALEDRIMPRDHGRRLAEILPDARLLEVSDSYTLIPQDQPALFSRAVRHFVGRTTAVASPDASPGVRGGSGG
jgi:pimeloyl-ACP methyl ester carboxylesterase